MKLFKWITQSVYLFLSVTEKGLPQTHTSSQTNSKHTLSSVCLLHCRVVWRMRCFSFGPAAAQLWQPLTHCWDNFNSFTLQVTELWRLLLAAPESISTFSACCILKASAMQPAPLHTQHKPHMQRYTLQCPDLCKFPPAVLQQ